jgi:hypothetical protein
LILFEWFCTFFSILIYDLREHSNFISEVRDQKNANSCFAFVVCQAIEFLFGKVNNERIVLSPQDVFQHLIRTEEQGQAGRSLSETFWWMRTYGCVKEVDCLYTQEYLSLLLHLFFGLKATLRFDRWGELKCLYTWFQLIGVFFIHYPCIFYFILKLLLFGRKSSFWNFNSNYYFIVLCIFYTLFAVCSHFEFKPSIFLFICSK